jgi:hypothetical protein
MPIPANAVVCLSDRGVVNGLESLSAFMNVMPLCAREIGRRLIIARVITAHDLREKLRRIFLTGLVLILGLAILAYGIDFAVFRVRVATNRNPYGSVVVNHYYAILQKNGKTQFIFDPPQPEACVNALFPHGGSQPCWYLSRHPDQKTNI